MTLFCIAAEAHSETVKIESLTQITEFQPANTVYFFDIDDTIFDSPSMVGSKAWRKYIKAATEGNSTQNWHDTFSLFIARNYPVQTVEAITSDFVQNLQAKGHKVLGLTARARQMWYDTPADAIDVLTINQLESVGVTFDETWHLNSVPEYFKGVFFTDTEEKGPYLLKLFTNPAHFPEKVVFIDDKQKQVESVAEVLSQLGIDYECYWYTATDEKVAQFNPLVAALQLYYLWISNGERIIFDEEAAQIAEQYPEKNAEDYLQSLLNN